MLRRLLPGPLVALTGDLVRALLRAAVLALAAVALWTNGRLWAQMLRAAAPSDFAIFYHTSRMLLDGHAPYSRIAAYLPPQWPADHLGNINAPHVQWLMMPLGLMPYRTAFLVWLSVTLLLGTAALVDVFRELRWPAGGWSKLLAFGAIGTWAPVVTVSVTGELTFLLLWPAVRMWIAARHGRWTAAGAWLGVCLSAKLFFLLFLPWLVVRRQWRAVCAACVSAPLAMLVGAIGLGPGAWGGWLHALRHVTWWQVGLNASVRGFMQRLLDASGYHVPDATLAWQVAAVWVCLAAAIAAVSLWRIRQDKTLSGPAQIDGEMLLLTAAALLVSPLGWVYYGPLLLPPLLGTLHLGTRARSSTRLATVAGVAALYVPYSVTSWWSGSPGVLLSLGSAYFWGVATIWTATVLDAGGRRLSFGVAGPNGGE